MIIIKIIDKLLNFILITFFLIIIFFSLYALYDVKQVYDGTKLTGDILKYKPEEKKDAVESFDLDSLQQNINPDICGWIKIDGTNIDYPILYPDTSLEYLSKAYNGKYNAGGSIFIDTLNDRYFNDDYTVIYGHNMSSKQMFSDIKLFNDFSFFEKNKGGKLYIKDQIYDIKIYTFNVLESNSSIAYRIDDYKKGRNSELIKSFEDSAIYKNDIEISPDDKFIMLTTCNGVATTKRAVLFAKLEKSGSLDNTISGVDRDEKEKEKKKLEREQEEKINKYKLDNNKNYNKNKIKQSSPSKLYSYLFNIKVFFIKIIYNPIKLSLFILIIFTIVIYGYILAKKIKDKRNKK